MTNSTLLANVTTAISNAFKGTVGGGSHTEVGLTLVGITILIVFIYWIFTSGVGIWGMIVIIPALILILSSIPGQVEGSTLGYLPPWVGAITWIIVGAIWGLILLKFFGER